MKKSLLILLLTAIHASRRVLRSGSDSEGGSLGIGRCVIGVLICVNNLCSAQIIEVFTISQPPLLEDSISGTNITCNGDTDGSVDLIVTGGTAAFTYSWTGPNAFTAVSEDISTLEAGNYTVTVTDAMLCTVTDSATLTEPALITGAENVSICNGDSILLEGVYQNTAGTYYDTLTAANGCDSVISTTLTVNPLPTVSFSGLNANYCSTDAGVTMTGTPAGGTFSGTGGVSGFQFFPVTGVNTYTVTYTYTDTNGCTASNSATVTVNPNPVVSLSSTDDAGGCIGSVTATVTTGTPPFSYLWNDPASQTNVTCFGLCSGPYDVLVTDSNGCMASEGIVVGSSGCTLSASVSSTNATCGNNDGSAIATVSGGTLPYTYSWSSGDTLANTDSLSAGIYTVDVWDANVCNAIGVATISNTSGPTITVNNIFNVSCNGGNDGEIQLNVSGGTPPYDYAWSSGDSTTIISQLQAGPYDLMVTDGAGCISSVNLLVGSPDALSLNITVSNASCGNSDGSVSLGVGGGTQPYSYLWSNAATSTALTGLASGTYSVIVTDSNGCVDSMSIGLSETGAASIVTDSVISAPCSGTGGIYISTVGGIAPITYLWSNGVGVEDNPGIAVGIYDVTVTDSSGCMAVASYEVTAQVLDIQPICLVSVDTIDPINIVVWEKPASTSIDFYNIYKESTAAGVYFLAGTIDYDSLSVFMDPNSNPNQRSWRYKITAVDFCGNESGFGDVHKTMHVSISPGLGNDYNVSWNHYEGFSYPTYYVYRYRPVEGWLLKDSLPSNLSTWTDFAVPQGQVDYVVEAKHPSGCLATKTKNYNSSISNKSNAVAMGSLTSNTSSINASLGNCDGSATAAPTGGTPPYTYLWNDSLSQTTATAVGLCPGVYSVIISDADGNTVIDTSVVGEAAGAAPIVDYFADFTLITEGDSVNFTDQSTNAPTTWFWVLTGGNPGTSSVQNPTDVQYNTVGTYDVQLIATNSFGSDTLAKTDYIIVGPKVGVSEFALGPRNVKVSPNPFADNTVLTFENAKKDQLDLLIYNSLGGLVREYGSITGEQVTIEKADLAPGTYYYLLMGEEDRDIGVIVVQ